MQRTRGTADATRSIRRPVRAARAPGIEDLVTRTTLRALLWLASALAVVGYLVLAWRALAGGPPADPLEASVLEHAVRFAQGQSPYAEPRDGGAPLMPVFPLVVSLLVRLVDAWGW